MPLGIMQIFLSSLLLTLLTSTSVASANGIWITTCNYSHSLNDDPIVFPGMPGASHLHDFVGSSGTNAHSTAESMQAGNTTCVMPDDTSAYWVPATYEDGVRVLPTASRQHVLLYYRRGGLRADVTIQPFPTGLRMILGNMHAKTPDENPAIGIDKIHWKCGPGGGKHLTAPPTTCPSNGFMVQVFQFPQCWDGQNLDSLDHLSHMSYLQGGRCPTTHPVALPQITAYWRMATGNTVGNITYSSGPYYSAHMDVFLAWRGNSLAALTDECLNGNINCGTNPIP